MSFNEIMLFRLHDLDETVSNRIQNIFEILLNDMNYRFGEKQITLKKALEVIQTWLPDENFFKSITFYFSDYKLIAIKIENYSAITYFSCMNISIDTLREEILTCKKRFNYEIHFKESPNKIFETLKKIF